ncbi:MAG: hypothetical protein GXO71_05355 [Caldiserica bacterium]|nr:hypothetical protein [Caldisericota bacterium]
MIKLFIILGFILFIHFIQKFFRVTATQDEYIAKQEEIEKFLRQASSEQEEIQEFPLEIPPSQPEEERQVSPPQEREEPVTPTAKKPEPEAPSYFLEEEIMQKPRISLTREGLRNAVLYQAILGPPRAEEEWEWRGLK